MDKKIMVCDDDQGILEMVEMIIEEYGYNVCTEANSMQLLQTMVREKPDLLLLDIWMPVLSGDQVLKSLRADSKFDAVPVIMYSASAEGAAIAKKSGADDYLSKPFDIDILVEKIKKLI